MEVTSRPRTWMPSAVVVRHYRISEVPESRGFVHVVVDQGQQTVSATELVAERAPKYPRS